jgi:hypothetical protein
VSNIIINGGDTQRSRITAITVNFSTAIDTAIFQNPGAVTLTRLTPAASITVGSGLTITPGAGNAGSIALAFNSTSNAGIESGSLADGLWQLAIPSLGYTSPNLGRLFGDDDANGTVNATDFAVLGNAFGTTLGQPGFRTAFDFDGNNTINALDLAAFGNRFGITL